MDFDSIANGSVSAFSKDFSKDFGKKKRNNRLAKLKQCKLDARREQWLSQAKNKEPNGGGAFPPSVPVINEEKVLPLENHETGVEENEGSSVHDSDLESLGNSSRSNDSRKDRPGSSCGSSSGSSISGCCSGNFTEEEEEDDGCLDDWEAVADALTANEKQHRRNLEPPEQDVHVESDARPVVHNKADLEDIPKAECMNTIPRTAPRSCAWRPDDTFRPQSLPNLSKQYSFTTNSEQRHLICGSDAWTRNNTISAPTPCPICYEELDFTDSSFLPCICGFRLCLFCHKRIFEVGDCRCPGCRRPYDPIDGNAVVNGQGQKVVNGGAMAFRLPRSYSMSRRSLARVCH